MQAATHQLILIFRILARLNDTACFGSRIAPYCTDSPNASPRRLYIARGTLPSRGHLIALTRRTGCVVPVQTAGGLAYTVTSLFDTFPSKSGIPLY